MLCPGESLVDALEPWRAAFLVAGFTKSSAVFIRSHLS